MCGIFGVVRMGGLQSGDRWLLRGMADAMQHRGPDGEGFHLSARAGIGMTRLAIIDLEGGWQPLYNEDRSLALVLNGEIYNYVELRKGLEARGHRFATNGDAETVLHLYEDMGLECIHQLRGMFAFALLDERKQKLVLARDRMGEKPLSIVEREDGLVFCSELVGLVGSGAVPFELDPDAVKLYYYWNYVPEPISAVRGVRKLPAASLLEIDLKSGQRAERAYWRLEDAPPIHDEPVERIRSEIDEIGRIIIRSDVPVGVGLSGGIDSSAVAALAKKHSDRPVVGFTIGYEGWAWQDERAMAREFADHLGIDFHELRLSLDTVVREFPEMCLRRDEPLSDWSGAGFYSLMHLSREHGVPVLLTGLGGDELFWGYPWVRAVVEDNRRKLRLRENGGGVLDYLRIARPPLSLAGAAYWVGDGAGLLRGWRDWQRDRSSSAEQLVFWDARPEYRDCERNLHRVAGEALAGAHLSPTWPFTGRDLWPALETSITKLMCETFLRANGLVMGDRLSMSWSVEARVPFVDYRLAEVVVGLRKAQSDLPLGHKAWLKQALSDLVPPFVFQRRKRGFTPPWRQWTKALMERYADDLRSGVLVERGILRPRAAAHFRTAFDGMGRALPLAFPSLVLEEWARGMLALERSARQVATTRRGEPELRERHGATAVPARASTA
jgi:asparagine synthase (glutamine-hydrolysing)